MMNKLYPNPSEKEFYHLALNNPQQLVDWINSDTLEHGMLTYAVEALGKVKDANLAINTLLKYSKHTSPLVREGAVYGLESYVNEQSVIDRLEEMLNDDSEGVRQAVVELLEDVEYM